MFILDNFLKPAENNFLKMNGFDGFLTKFSKNGLVLSESEIGKNVKIDKKKGNVKYKTDNEKVKRTGEKKKKIKVAQFFY